MVILECWEYAVHDDVILIIEKYVRIMIILHTTNSRLLVLQ